MSSKSIDKIKIVCYNGNAKIKGGKFSLSQVFLGLKWIVLTKIFDNKGGEKMKCRVQTKIDDIIMAKEIDLPFLPNTGDSLTLIVSSKRGLTLEFVVSHKKWVEVESDKIIIMLAPTISASYYKALLKDMKEKNEEQNCWTELNYQA